MGVKNLWDILESCKKTLPLHHLQNKRVCVDLSCWIVQLHTVNKSHCSGKEKGYLKGLFHRLRALIALNCSLIFVTDGSIPAIKVSTYRRRLNGGSEPPLDAGNPKNVLSVKRNMGSEFSCMIKEAKFLGGALGIPCLDGIEEAEAQCALLNSESLCDGCFTSDSDVFLFGARTVYRDICLGEGGYVVCYEMDDIETKLGFGRNSLITLAVLLGSDYTQGVRGFGPESACQIVKSIGDSTILRRFASEGLSIVKKPKSTKKKSQNLTHNDNENSIVQEKNLSGCERDSPVDNQFLHVINAYLRPKCHSADSDAVHRVVALYPFNHSQLHQICAQFFEWPPEKTDEYILPKIAEQNLRRYANLRSSSSKLGLNLPINEMPVKCPVSSIIKQRKIQGRDYFEVTWEDMDGLKSSVVPANLVESACPEKISNFHQERAQKQKPTGRPRLKMVETKEIKEKLQELLLGIEQASTITTNNAFSLGALSPRKILPVCQTSSTHQRSHLHTQPENTGWERAQSSGNGSRIPTSSETEVIDLISPLPLPPQPRAHEVSKSINVIELSDINLISPLPLPPRACAHEVSKSIDVIELSDTEDEASPEHARRAQELRSFMARIRDQIS